MKPFLAIVTLFVIIFSFLQNWLLLALVLSVFYSLRFGAIILIPVAILIDGYFGNFHTWPYLSLLAVVWYVIIEYLRPKLIDRLETKEL